MSSSHLSRKDLKSDAFAAEVGHGVEYVAHHKRQATLITVGILVLILAIGGFLFFRNRQADARAEAYAKAREILSASVGSTAQSGPLSFPTQEEKDKAQTAAFAKIASDYPGTAEGSLARMHLASVKMEKDDIEGAISDYREVMDKGPAQLASTAKLAVAQLLWGQGKTDEGKNLLQELIDRPTEFVSADRAKLTLARLQVDSNPEEARKLLESLSGEGQTAKMLSTDLLNQLPN